MSLFFLVTLLTLSPVNGQIVSFSENFVSSDSESDGTTFGNPYGSLSNTNSPDDSDYVISEENRGKRTTYYKEITIDSVQVTGDLTNFPVLVSITDADLKQHAQSDGDDILFYNDQGQKLSHEIEIYDPNYSGSEAQLVAWVKANLSSTVDTKLTMRYGHDERISEQDPTNVWDNNYVGVYHLNNDPSVSAPQVLDSTSYGNDGTSSGSMTDTDLVAGKIGSAIQFDGVNDHINMGNDVSLQMTSAITIEAWFYVETDVGLEYYISKGGEFNDGWDLGSDPGTGTAGTTKWRFTSDTFGAYAEGNSAIDIDNWYHAAGVFSSLSLERFYFNGALVSDDITGIPSGMYNTTYDVMLGYASGAGTYYEGLLDEARISNTGRSTEWIDAQYNNQNSPDTFYTISNQLEHDGWQSYKELSVDHSIFDADLDGFPYHLELYDSDLKNYAQTDGDDIAFFNKAGEQLPHEIELYNPNFNSTHAQLVAWVKIDASASVDTRIVMKYNDPDQPSQENPTAVWDDNHSGVWHLEEDPSGSAPQMLDSTDGDHHGTSVLSPTTVSGQILNGLEFTDTSGQNVNVPHSSDLVWSETFTISLWAYSQSDSTWQTFVGKTGTGGENSESNLYFGLTDTGELFLDLVPVASGSLETFDPGEGFSLNTWHHVAVTYDSTISTATIFLDGTAVATKSDYSGSVMTTNTNPLSFGYNENWPNEVLDGYLDEIHISNIPRSTEWIGALYNNQLDPESTYSISEEYNRADWEYYKDIYIDSSNINSDLTDFPVMFALNDTDLKDKALSNGQDIAFFSDTGTKLNHELIEYNSAFNSTHAHLLAWIETDLYQATDTRIEIRYGNTTNLPDQSNMKNTWSGYNNVWHLEEDPSGISPQTIDSRGSNYGTSGGSMTSGDLVDGQVREGIDFDGVDDRVTVGAIDMDDWTSVSVSLWFKYESAGGQYINLFSSSNTTSHLESTISITINDAYADSRQISVRIGTDGVGGSDGSILSTAVDTFGLNEWVHVAVTWDSASELIKMYVNGEELISSFKDGDNMRSSTRDVVIGNTAVSTQERPFPGVIDEVKLSQIAYPEDWFDVEYTNQFNPLFFFSNISEEKGNQFYDYIDEETSTDSKENLGSVSQFGDLRSTDDQTTILTERAGTTNNYAFGTSGTGSMVIGDGSVNWNSLEGTIGFWLYENNVPGATERPYGSTNLMELRYGSAMSINVDWGIDNFMSNVYTLSTGTWYYIAIAWDENNDLLSLHIATESTFPVYSNTTTWTYTLAAETSGLNQFLNSRFVADYVDGYGDELRYYDAYLSESEIEYYHNRTITGKEDNLVSYYNFDNQDYDDIGPANTDGSTQGSGHTFSSSTKPSVQPGDSLFDWEAKFTEIPFTEVGVTLSIKTGVWSSGEDLELQYWSGSGWNTLTSTFSSNSWHNITINDYLYSSNFIIRFYDLDRTDDSVTDVWRIDSMLLYYEDYLTDWEQTISGINTFREYYDFAIYGGVDSADETYSVQLWDSGVGDWSNPYFTIDDTETWYNTSLDSNDIDSSMILRYIDSNRIQDFSQSSLNLDYISIDSYDRSPEITSAPSDVVYTEGTTGHSISWVASDLNPNLYTIRVNGSQVDFGFWSNGSINYDIDGLERGTYSITIQLNDLYTGITYDEVIVTVNDETLPTFTPANNLIMTEGDTGKTLNFTAFDLHPDYYQLYRNGSSVAIGTWDNANNITYSLDSEVKGYWNFTVVAGDDSGNNQTDTLFVTVNDETAPIIDSPADVNYDEDSTGNILTWTATDNYADYYVIYQNGSQIFSTTWTSGNGIMQNIDGLVVGNYNYTIVVFDASGNYVRDVILVFSRDTTDPSVSSPSNFQYEQGNTGNLITWTLSDTNPFTYTIYRDSVQLFTAGWTNGDIAVSADGLSFGSHNFTIVVRDDYGNQMTDTVLVLVTDNAAPTFTTEPSNATVSESSTGNKVSWVGSDINPDTYVVYQDGMQVASTTWSSGATLSYTYNTLSKGIYNFTVVLTDDAGNEIVSTAWITVIDTINPTLTSPNDLTYEYGSTSNSITWTATDNYANTSVIYIDGVVHQTNTTWISGVGIQTNIDGLSVGEYNFTIVVSDDSGNIKTDTVFVTVEDTILPIITDNTIVSYFEDETPKSIGWTATDSNAVNYYIYRNGTQVATGIWTSGVEILYTDNSLLLGTYNFSIILYDSSGNYATDTMAVTISDRIAPGINQPSNVTYSEGATGNSISWTISDNHPDHLIIYRNGSVVQSSSWTSGSAFISIDSLTLGNYNYTIYLNDTTGNSILDTVWVFVIDDTNPNVSNPENQTISEVSIGNVVEWDVTDTNPDYYIIYTNGSADSPVTWESGNTITFDLDSLTRGVYNITIWVFDTSGNNITHTVWITVNDLTSPSITSPSDFTYESGTTGNQISWIPTDNYDANYTIFLNDEINSTGSWTSGVPVIINVDGLSIGNHNFTFYVQDEDGNTAFDTVIITVEDTIIPIISEEPSDFQYNEGVTSNELAWTATDQNANTYRIYRNSTPITSDISWNTGVQVTINVDGLLLGVYNYTIVFQDTSGNTVENTAFVTIIDQNNPSITPQSDDNYSEGSTGNSISWPVSDTHPNQVTIYRNGSIILSNSWTSGTLSINIDGLGLGNYNYTIVLSDSSGNIASDTVIITVYDNTFPVLNQPSDIIVPEDELGNVVSWIATDLHQANYTIYRNGTQVKAGNWVSGANITSTLNNLIAGIYNYTIIVQDQTGNLVSDEIIVIVTAESVFTSTPLDTNYVIGTTGNELQWVVTDVDEDKYIIYQNGSIVDSGSWSDNVPIIWNIDGLSIGNYNFSIYINDTNGNYITDQLLVTVSDMPLWDTQPTDVTYSEGSTSPIIYNATDQFPDTYVVYQNGSFFESGSWDNSTDISVDISSLLIGIYNFTIYINDTSNNIITHWVIITIEDTTDPIFSNTQSDYTTSEATENNEISWTITDNYASNYTILINSGSGNSTFATNNWTSGVPITYNIDHLTIGVYSFYILVQDSSGNIIQDLVIITIEDQTFPEITNSNIVDNSTIITEVSTNNWLNVTATDTYTDTVTIYDNSTGTIMELSANAWVSNVAVNHSLEIYNKGVYLIIFEFTDISGNSINQSYIITVIDITIPSIDQTDVTSTTITEVSSGNWINVTATDAYAQSFEVWINDVLNVSASGSWMSGTPVEFNLIGFIKGDYNITFVFFDESGNSNSTQVDITVIDVTVPDIQAPNVTSTTVNETASTNWINVTATDAYAQSFEVWVNDVLNASASGSWMSGTPVEFNLIGFIKGDYNITFVFFDESGNSNSIQVDITVIDENPPSIDNSNTSGIIMVEGDAEHWVNVTASDSYAQSYEIWVNDALNVSASGVWISGETIEFNMVGLLKNTYNVTIVFIDASGNRATIQFDIDVEDQTNPSAGSPSVTSTTITEVSEGNWINVTATDAYAQSYEVWINDVLNVSASGPWMSGTPVEYNIDFLIKGDYNISIVFIDASGNRDKVQVDITVIDVTNPEIDSTSNDGSIMVEGVNEHWINVTVSDAYAQDFEIYVNEVLNSSASGLWTTGTPIEFNLFGFVKGDYNITFVFFDESGNNIIYQIDITVVDQTVPSIDENSSTTITISDLDPDTWANVTASDNYAASYEIWVNDILNVSASGVWTSEEAVDYNLAYLEVGSYNITIVFIDESGNSNKIEFNVTVEDTTLPSIDPPSTSGTAFSEISTDNWVNVSATDKHALAYEVWINDILNESDIWISGQSIEIFLDNLTYNTYNITFVFIDQYGNLAKIQVDIDVLDETIPDVSSPNVTSAVFPEGSTGNWINVTSTDLYAQSYEIWVNDILNVSASDSWTSGEAVEFYLIGYLKGSYNITVVFIDQSGNTNKIQVDITVIDDILPNVGSPNVTSTTIAEGSNGNWINVTATDSYAQNYEIWVNDLLNISSSGVWTTGEQVEFNLIGFTKGNYNITIVFIDESGNNAKIQVDIDVIDIVAPSIDNSSSSVSPVADLENSWFNVTASDNYASTYNVYINSLIANETGVWVSGEPVNYNLEFLPIGTYNVTIEFVDASGNKQKTEINITIQDETIPIFNSPPSNFTITEDVSGNKVVWNVEDIYPSFYEIRINSTSINVTAAWNSNPENIEYFLDELVEGVYIFNITIYDTSGNFASHIVQITVVDLTAPVISNVSNQVYEEGSSSNTFSFTPTDNHPGYYNVTIESDTYPLEILQTNTWSDGENIIVSIDGYLLGDYLITMLVYDESGNLQIRTILLQVYEVTPPQFASSQYYNVTYNEGETVLLNWTVTDNYNATYIVYIDGILQPSLGSTWASGVQEELSIVGLLKGTYNVTVYFRDTSLNRNRSTVFIEIIDTDEPTVDGTDSYDFDRNDVNNIISFDPSDAYSGIYSIYRNGSVLINNAIWTNSANITFNTDGTPLGYYNFTVLVFDASGNFNTSTSWVNVSDVIAPQISMSPSNFSYSEGALGFNLQWIATDVTPSNWVLFQNGVQIRSAAFISGVTVTHSFNTFPLTKGVYNFTIVFYDLAGNYVSVETTVEVLDTTIPVFDASPGFTTYEFTEGTTGHSLSWSMIDNYANVSILYQNGTIIAQENWMNNILYTYDIAALSFGIYNYTMLVLDDSGNQLIETIIITVYDLKFPEFTDIQDNFVYNETVTGYSVSWTATELHPDYYEFRIGNQLNSSGIWSSDIPLVFDIDGLSYGTYNISITVYDKSGNFASEFIIINVEDVLEPVIIEYQGDTTIDFGDPEGRVQWIATDLNPDYYAIYINGIQRQSRGWTSGNPIVYQITTLDIGYYTLTIEIYDKEGLLAIDEIVLRIKDPNVTDTFRPDIEIRNSVYEGDYESINGTWIDEELLPVAGGEVTVTLSLQEVLPSRGFTVITDSNGMFELEFNYTGLIPGVYTWHITFEAENYQSWDDISIQVTISPHTYSISITTLRELVQGEIFIIPVTVTYSNQYEDSSSGLGLSAFVPQSRNVIGVTVFVSLQFITTDGATASLDLEGITNQFGIANIEVDGRTTRTIAEIRGISARINSDNTQNSAEFNAESFPTIIEGSPDILTQLLNFIQDQVRTIITILISLFFVFVIIFLIRSRSKQRIEELNQSIKLAQDEISALITLKSIIIQSKSKLTLYEELLNRDDDMNTGLIGGMVTAFSSFLNEISRSESENEFGFETMERGDVSLTVHRGFESNIIIISDRKLPFHLLSQLKSAQEKVEYEFKAFLQNTERGVKKLKKEQVHPVLVEGGFKIDLLEPLKLNLGNLRSVLRERTVSRTIKANIQLLQELPGTRFSREGVFKLTDLIDFFASKAINRRISSRIIMAAYQFNVIVKEN